jgi:hypothetical protein
MAAGATTDSAKKALARDQRFTDLARAGDYDAIAREFGPRQPPIQPAAQAAP